MELAYGNTLMIRAGYAVTAGLSAAGLAERSVRPAVVLRQ